MNILFSVYHKYFGVDGTLPGIIMSADPAAQAHKFYARGLGPIKEVELGSWEEVVLTEYYPPAE